MYSEDAFNEGEIKEADISLDKCYCLPESIVIRKHREVYLAIYTEGISWIVLKDDISLGVFLMLKDGATIAEALEAYGEDAVSEVVTQIEAKHFDEPRVAERGEINMYVILTNRCNQRCRHCYMYAGDIEYSELTSIQWMKILDDFKNSGGNGVTFTGGEVTVYPGYETLIKHAYNIGLSVTVLSNGILWTQEVVDSLHSYIDEIQISVDGYDSSSYFAVRRYDGFDKAMKCIDRFYDAGTKVSMAVTPLFDDLDAFIDGFEAFAHDFIKRYPEVSVKLNLELLQGREISPTREENTRYRKRLKRLVERLYPNYYIEGFVLNNEDHIIRRNCGFGEISIAPNGDIYWCNRITELTSQANVLTEDFDTIMALSSRVNQNTSVDNTLGCEECDVRYICGGGCRLEYEGIANVLSRLCKWSYQCPGKEEIYERMVISNEYFFE